MFGRWKSSNSIQIQPKNVKKEEFPLNRLRPYSVNLHINGNPITVADSFQALGLTFKVILSVINMSKKFAKMRQSVFRKHS